MVQIIAVIISLIAIVTTFFSILWGWLILWASVLCLLVILFIVKRKKWQHIPELSDTANKMLQKFGHFYFMPFAGTDFSSSATTFLFAGVVVAIIGVFKGFWWGIGIGAINWFATAFVSRAFNPTNFLVDFTEQRGHDEIISWIAQRRKSRAGVGKTS